MDDRAETLIVGGSISGLACARALCDAGRPFVLVTDRLGGRMYHSADASMNFGATYVNADYRHVLRYVGRGLPLRLCHIHGQHADGRPVPLLSARTLRSWRPLGRLVGRLVEWRRALRAFRREAEHAPQADLAPRHPLLDRYRRQPAAELVRELGLGGLHDEYAAPAYWATCFAGPLEGNALFYLSALLPLAVPIWVADFTHTYARLTAGYRDRILIDRVVGLARRPDGGWEARTAGGREIRAADVVLAAPYHNLSALYPVPRPEQSPAGAVLFAEGERRPCYRGKNFVLFRPGPGGLTLLWRQRHGRDLLFSLGARPDLRPVYQSHQVVASVSWKTAVVLSGAGWAPLVLGPGLYLAGDYNLCGLEDSFITGLCAARHVLRPAPHGWPS
jgi:hypothetical protein